MSQRNLKRQNERGFAALIVVLLAATLASLSVLTIDFGKSANRVSNEKQLLDTHGVIVGQQIIRQGLSSTCDNGEFTGDTASLSEAMFGEINTVSRDERTYECEEMDGGQVITREEGDPNGPPGTFRRYRVSSSYNAAGEVDNPNQDNGEYKRSVIVEVRELNGEVERPRPQIMFVLDYSGSMSSNNRNGRLENAVREFISVGYEVDYGVIFFDSGVRKTIALGSGAAHNSAVLNELNNQGPSGGTRFHGPLVNAVQALNVTGNQHSYIVLVSDGQPSDGGSAQNFVNNAIRGIDPNICASRSGNETCHTVYGLGVDGADMAMLTSLSGNAATPPNQYGSFSIPISAQDTQLAFRAIVDDILCSFGPIDPQPSEDEEKSINVFLNDEPLEADPNFGDDTVTGDFTYDRNLNAIKLYDVEPRNACSKALADGGSVTIRYGKPRIIPESSL